jgi:hypothetical protein
LNSLQLETYLSVLGEEQGCSCCKDMTDSTNFSKNIPKTNYTSGCGAFSVFECHPFDIKRFLLF